MKTQLAKLALILVLFSINTKNEKETLANAPSGIITSGKPPLTINPQRDLITYKSSSNKLTPEMLAAIEKAATGTKVYFENIKAVGPDGKTRYLAPITLILKQ